MKKVLLTEAEKKAIIVKKSKVIIENFNKTFNSIKRLDEENFPSNDTSFDELLIRFKNFNEIDSDLEAIKAYIKMAELRKNEAEADDNEYHTNLWYGRLKAAKNKLNTINGGLSETSLIKEETFDDLFKFLATDPKTMTVGTAYYVADMNSSMNKFILNDASEKVPNPMYDKLYKNTRFIFKWNDTYGRAIERKNPEHEMGQRSGTFEKIQGYDVIEKGKNGLYLPIIPTGSEATYSKLEDGQFIPIDKEEVKKYLRPSKPSTGSGVDFRLLMMDKIAKLTGGGNVWVNPNFNSNYGGVGAI